MVGWVMLGAAEAGSKGGMRMSGDGACAADHLLELLLSGTLLFGLNPLLDLLELLLHRLLRDDTQSCEQTTNHTYAHHLSSHLSICPYHTRDALTRWPSWDAPTLAVQGAFAGRFSRQAFQPVVTVHYPGRRWWEAP